MEGISAIIITRNNVERVKKLCEKIKTYVDEIIIVDSSSKDLHEKLKKIVPYAKIFYVPPLGFPEFYEHMAFRLASYDWILYLDDDDFPNLKLLKELRKLIKNKKVKAYRIRRVWLNNLIFFKKNINIVLKNSEKLIRLFRKDIVQPLGLIHWHYLVPEYKDLDDDYYIISFCSETLLQRIKKLNRYSIIEALQIGIKILHIIYAQRRLYKIDGKPINMLLPGKIKCMCIKFLEKNKFNLVYLVLAYIIISTLFTILKYLSKFKLSIITLRYILWGLWYSIVTSYYILRKLHILVIIWYKYWPNPIEKLGITKYEDFLQLNFEESWYNNLKLLFVKLNYGKIL